MRELNNTKIIAVDHGYGNIKTANTVTPTALTAYDSEPVFSGNILEYNGTYYRIGEGRKEFIPDKAADEDDYILTLMAVARELNLAGISEADVHLAAGLPLTWVRRQREEFRNYLLRNEDVQFKFKRKGYRLHFTGCSLYPQGYPAVVNRLNEFKGTNLLADIGNGTMNILYIVDKKPVESRSWTEKIGVNQCMIAARNAVMDNFGVKIEDATIEKVLRLGKADIGRYYLDCIQNAIRIVANLHTCHPIRDYLISLEWDGQERMGNVLHHFLGADNDELTRECMKIFMLGAIERVFHPGCKYEAMLCLVGDQGVGKP